MHQEFLEQLKRSPEGWYETALPWKGAHPPLPNNKTGSLKHLASLVQRLKRNGKLEDYDAIIQQQLEGVVEEAEGPAQVNEFYIPHKAVIRESSEMTKMQIVYDASARAYDYPVYLPDSEMYTEKFVQHAHEATLHGGVSLTMAKVRETHWVPRLR